MLRLLVIALGAFALSAISTGLWAEEAQSALPNADQICLPEDDPADRFRRLRALSLDLRGTVPTVAEFEALRSAPDVPDEMIDAWLQSEEFITQAVRWHRDLLWNSVNNVDIFSNNAMLSRRSGIYWRGSRATAQRGERVLCLDEPAVFDEAGLPVQFEQEDGSRREGWVELSPYWAPEETIRVCALDAMEHEVASNGAICAIGAGVGQVRCGCGPNLNWCATNDVRSAMRAAIAEDTDLRVAALFRQGRPYTELFTGTRGFVNGPIVHFWRHQRRATGGLRNDPPPIDLRILPNLNYSDQAVWREIEMGAWHSGVLTSPAFLLRFMTNRARANRFYNAFLCRPFQAPVGGLPEADSDSALELDLQKRDGCKYCHALLEPSALHWGRWEQQGMSFSQPEDFPAYDADCYICGTTGQGCTTRCRNDYLTRTLGPSMEPYLGFFTELTFIRQEHRVHLEAGPRLLALNAIVDERLPQCSARTAVERFFGRKVLPEEEAWVVELGRSFVQEGFDYRALVKAILKSETYGRIR